MLGADQPVVACCDTMVCVFRNLQFEATSPIPVT